MFECLDQAFWNFEWCTLFLEATILHLARLKSDHHPMLLQTNLKATTSNNKTFRFEKAWTSHSVFKQVLLDNWINNLNLVSFLTYLFKGLKDWNHCCQTPPGPASWIGKLVTRTLNRSGLTFKPLSHLTQLDPVKPGRVCVTQQTLQNPVTTRLV